MQKLTERTARSEARLWEGSPAIGIGCDVHTGPPAAAHLHLLYSKAILRSGGLPFLLPPLPSSGAVDRSLDRLDGLLLTGGDDYDPAFYGQRRHRLLRPAHPARQRADIRLARRALRRGIPILGICNGLQLLNIALGGDLVQDLPALWPGAGVHRAGPGSPPASHPVTIGRATLLGELAGRGAAVVNSSHHQAVGRLGRGLIVSAVAPDGVVEAIEAGGRRGRPPGKPRFLLGVQWHPERDESRLGRSIFDGLVWAASMALAERAG
jgi:putative glutamine amidotransferase